ncbi:MAG TPA: gamma-glutamylcyclotransferase family protein [Polyangiaceae bacterium]|nr:gamma-glutamylcyclotransferase family protein [Polyangiaceae bacterium]
MTRACLFVYGSLKRDGRHHAELGGAPFLSTARTLAGYALEPLGEYLALVEAPGPGCVPGELFEVEEHQLEDLDTFEGEGYARMPLMVIAQNGENVAALAYLRRTR